MTSTALMNAILAMESYNRGYNASIDLRPRDANGDLILDGNGEKVFLHMI
jgi:hypothetical protein